MLNSLRKKLALFITPREIRLFLRDLAQQPDATVDKTKTPYVVVLDGFLGILPLSLYFILLLLALRHQLKRPVQVVLVSRKFWHRYLFSNRIFTLLMKTTFVSLAAVPAQPHTRSRAAAVFKGLATQRSILSIEIDGILFGPNIYSGYLRDQMVGTVAPTEPKLEKLIVQAFENLDRAAWMVQRFKPDLLMLSHSDYHTFGSLFKKFLQLGVPVVVTIPYGTNGRAGGRVYTSLDQWEHEPRNYALGCSDKTWGTIKSRFGEHENEVVQKYLNTRFAGEDELFDGRYHKSTTRLQRAELLSSLGVQRNYAAVALIASHLLWDDVATSYRNLYCDYTEWTARTLSVATKNKEVLWIIKAHPSEIHIGTNARIREIIKSQFQGQLPENILFLDADTPFNTYSLIDAVDAVITVRGTIAFEAACRGKTVVNAGTGPCTGQGFTVEFNSIDEYEAYLSSLHTQDLRLSPEKVRLARIGIYAYMILKCPQSEVLSRYGDWQSPPRIALEKIVNDPLLASFSAALANKVDGDLL